MVAHTDSRPSAARHARAVLWKERPPLLRSDTVQRASGRRSQADVCNANNQSRSNATPVLPLQESSPSRAARPAACTPTCPAASSDRRPRGCETTTTTARVCTMQYSHQPARCPTSDSVFRTSLHRRVFSKHSTTCLKTPRTTNSTVSRVA